MVNRTFAAAACVAVTLLAGAAAATEPVAPAVVTITMSGMRFIPEHIRLQAHTSYVLRLMNQGTTSHNLSAPDFFHSAALPAASVQALHDGEVDLPPGKGVDITLTTGDAGSYAMHCTMPFHTLMGMTGRIDVR